MKKSTIIILILDILIAICFFIVYGPISYIRNTVISTAMVTKTHQYIAYTFYNSETINKVIQMDSYIPFDEDTNLEEIIIDTEEKASYASEYEKSILTRDKGNDLYKLINIEIDGIKAYLVAIYDPSKVKLGTLEVFNKNNSGREKLVEICERIGAVVGINGGGFQDPDGWGSDIPMGNLIKDGKIIWSENDKPQSMIGFTNKNKLILISATAEEALKKGVRDALQFGPFLIVNGKSIRTKDDSAGGYNRAARSAIAQRKDGIVLFLVTEGVHTNGPRLIDIAETLEKYGAYNAANLDGGSSVQLSINNNLVNNPVNIYGKPINGRNIVSAFVVMP